MSHILKAAYPEGKTALHLSSRDGHSACVQRLLQVQQVLLSLTNNWRKNTLWTSCLEKLWLNHVYCKTALPTMTFSKACWTRSSEDCFIFCSFFGAYLCIFLLLFPHIKHLNLSWGKVRSGIFFFFFTIATQPPQCTVNSEKLYIYIYKKSNFRDKEALLSEKCLP